MHNTVEGHPRFHSDSSSARARSSVRTRLTHWLENGSHTMCAGIIMLVILVTGSCSLSRDRSSQLVPYRLLVAGSRGFESDIYLMDGNGTIIKQLTDTPNRAEMWPVLGGDSDSVFFEARTVPDKKVMICCLDLQSGREDTLYGPSPPGELWFALSPDARFMVYVIPETTHTSICIREVTSGREQIIHKEESRIIRPSWSPDSKQIVCQIRNNADKQWDLALVDTENCTIRQITDTPGITEFKARWSPDGSQIVTSMFEGNDRSRVRIAILTVQGDAVEHSFGSDRDRIISAVWSPDGKLAAVRERPLPLGVLIWPTGEPTTTVEPKKMPGEWKRGRTVWSPDGKYLAVNVSESRSRGMLQWRILIMDVMGHIVQRWPDEMSVFCPAWIHQ